MKRREFNLLFLFLMGLGLSNCNNQNSNPQNNPSVNSSNALRIWWSQGFYPEETEALKQVIANWEQQQNLKVDLTLYSEKDLPKQIESALKTGDTPDILYGHDADWTLIPRLAWENKLTDVSDILDSIKDQYTDSTLKSVYYLNNVTKKRSYYAVPITQITTNIHCWQDLLGNLNLKLSGIPDTWQEFWDFWEDTQESLKSKGLTKTHSIGFPMSPAASDTFVIFEQFLEGYNSQLLDQDGKLLLRENSVRQTIQEALTRFTNFYKNQEVPPEAINWVNADNNVSFLSRGCLMTANPTLSIPGSQRQDKATYNQNMATLQWPVKANGDPMRYLASVKQVVIFANSSKQQAAKDFLSYFVQPQNLDVYVKGSQGRFFPVMPQLLKDPFWINPDDPHISVAVKQLENTRPFYQVFNPAYSEVQARNIWGEVIKQIVTGDLTVEQGVDQAIQKIEEIFANWQS